MNAKDQDRGLEWLLQYVAADQGVTKKEFEARLGRQIRSRHPQYAALAGNDG